jgi:hypothetical protein
MNKKVVGYCGYRCDLCPTYARNTSTPEKRTRIRRGWNTFFGFDVPEERIFCVGCHQTGHHLDTECKVRPCAQTKRLENCSSCERFEICDTLRSRADIVDEIKKKYAGTISDEDYDLFFRPYEGRNELKKQRRVR